jgi:hypothetical protein
VCQQLEDGAGHEHSALHVTRRYATANWRPGEISADHSQSSAACSRDHRRCHPACRQCCWLRCQSGSPRLPKTHGEQ